MSVAAVSMFQDTLLVADRQIDSTKKHIRWANALLGVPVLLNMATVFVLNRGTYTLRRDAIVLKGVAANVAHTRETCLPGELPADNKKVQIEALVKVAQHVQRVRALGLAVESESARVNSAARAFVAAAADLYETLTELRWEFMELEASMARIDTGYVASNPEELDALFARITSE